MIKILAIFFSIFFISYIAANSQTTDSTAIPADTLWKKGGITSLNFSNVGLNNWAGGGTDMISLTGAAIFFADFKSEIMSWENTFEMGYGLVKQNKDEIRKSDDKLFFISKYGYNASPQLQYTALLDFRTQFDLGYDYSKREADSINPLLISGFMSPAYLNLGLGINYKPDEYWQLFFSVLSNRLILVLHERLSAKGAYGVAPGEHILSQLGANVNITFQKDIVENVNLRSRLNLFSAYDRIQSVVVNSETALNMKINSFMTASFALDVIYDDKVQVNRNDGTVGPATQLRHVISIGFSYNFGHVKK